MSTIVDAFRDFGLQEQDRTREIFRAKVVKADGKSRLIVKLDGCEGEVSVLADDSVDKGKPVTVVSPGGGAPSTALTSSGDIPRIAAMVPGRSIPA